MRAYETYMRLTAAEERACQLVIEEITSIAGTALPNSPLEIIGSHRTGLATPTSDIDVRFFMPEYEERDSSGRASKATTPKAKKARHKGLKVLCNALRESPRFMTATLINARIPIVRVVHRRTGLEVNIQSLKPSLAARTCVAAYLSEYPTLRPLYMILRFALEIRHLTTVFEGGFGSYAIFMMIVNALKHASLLPSTGHDATRYDLAAHLFWVLDFYAGADLRKNGYSLDPPSVFPKVVKRDQSKGPLQTYKGLKSVPKEPYLLCLQDPADPFNDLGRQSPSIKHVQEVFRQTSITLRNRLEDWDNNSSKERDPGQESLLDTLVGAHYGHFKGRRRILAKAATQAEEGGWGVGDRTHVPIPLGIRGGQRREF
ncbi:MAG: hypothetical protein LQ347_003908 [Umbilicaria vellea]|nr:MAG: hypothetical protein LQ347_003908 [Umbilicaria vellea]